MIEYIDICDIKPADYNPRLIRDREFNELKRSVKELGIIIPIIVNKANNTIIAGHQRTKAAKEVGMAKVPVYFVEGVSFGDEIKFNQIHNAVDDDEHVSARLCNVKLGDGFNTTSYKNFNIIKSNAPRVKEICKLILKYGNVLSAVILNDDVIVGTDYIKACSLLGRDPNIYITSNIEAGKYLVRQYGEYHYQAIKRETFVQGLAQLERKTEAIDGKKSQSSTLYERMVIPYLANKNTNTSILDFGCGKGAYIKMLSNKYDAIGVEFYNNNKKAINISKGNVMIDNLVKHIEDKGMFDVVVCDSVLNSVDSLEAELAVVRCLNIFAKEKIFLSGRPLDGVKNKYNMKKDRNVGKRFLEFLDKDNFSANFREGKWYFQHYHSKEQILDLLNRCGLAAINIHWSKYGDSFQIECEKIRELTDEEVESAINFEFNLPLPNGKAYNRHNEVLSVVLGALGRI